MLHRVTFERNTIIPQGNNAISLFQRRTMKTNAIKVFDIDIPGRHIYKSFPTYKKGHRPIKYSNKLISHKWG